MAGYSGKPLVQKLGIKDGWAIAILNAPQGYERTSGLKFVRRLKDR